MLSEERIIEIADRAWYGIKHEPDACYAAAKMVAEAATAAERERLMTLVCPVCGDPMPNESDLDPYGWSVHPIAEGGLGGTHCKHSVDGRGVPGATTRAEYERLRP